MTKETKRSHRKSLITPAAVILAVCFVVLFIGGGSRFVVGLTLRPIAEDLGWGRTELGMAVALFQLVSAGAMFVAGHLADRAGPRLVLGGGLLASGVGIGFMSMITAPWHAMLLYGVVYAVGNGAASLVPVGVMVMRAVPERAGLASAVTMSGMSVGQLVVIAAMTVVLATLSWHSVYLLLGAANLILVPLLFAAIPKVGPAQAKAARPSEGIGAREAARTRQFWLLVGVYAICGFDDFFVTTHVVAFAQDRGVNVFLAGNLLALMGFTGLIGVVAAGAMSDRYGPVWPTALSFGARVVVFGLLMVDQSTLSVTTFALVFGATFLVTAPLAVVFVSESFGRSHLGALSGLVIMVHQVCGGLGAYLGAAVFDATGTYDAAFTAMFWLSLVAVGLSVLLRRPKSQVADTIGI